MDSLDWKEHEDRWQAQVQLEHDSELDVYVDDMSISWVAGSLSIEVDGEGNEERSKRLAELTTPHVVTFVAALNEAARAADRERRVVMHLEALSSLVEIETASNGSVEEDAHAAAARLIHGYVQETIRKVRAE